MRQPILCLNMIVKNEASIIERLIDSVAPYIGYYVICDTGSRDNTVDLIESHFSQKKVPGEIHEVPFIDFEQARNAALERGRQSVGDFDYFLLTDADMELVVLDEDFARHLHAPAYSVKQESGSLAYYNTRLVHRQTEAAYVGKTHEYLRAGPVDRLDCLKFKDYACGSSRAEKIDRDLKLLRQAFEENPNDSRTVFYLAQTYRDAGLHSKAAEYYGLRTKFSNYPEEKWYSRYQLALAYKNLDDEPNFVMECLKAFEERPIRAEPIHELARYFRIKGQHHLAMLFANTAEKIPYPNDDALLIHDTVYKSGVSEEVSISGYYSRIPGDQERGRKACFALSTNPTAPESVVKTARRNCVFYARSASEMFGETSLKCLSVETPEGYQCHNPSIAFAPDGKPYAILRTSNYRVEDGLLVCNHPDNIVRTQNYFLALNDSFEIENCSTMEDHCRERPLYPTNVRGYEDCRLFFFKGKSYFTASVRDANAEARSEVVLARLDSKNHIEEAWVVPSPTNAELEKNWLPFVRDDQLLFLYSTDPTRILRLEPEQRKIEEVCLNKPVLRFDHLRGGSQIVPIDGGWLYVAHEVTGHTEKLRRKYLHRFLFLDENLVLTRASDPFVFHSAGIEFCAGLAFDHKKDQLVVSFGSNESAASLLLLTADAVMSTLNDVGP